MKIQLLLLVSFIIVGCSGKFTKDYELVDASSEDVPEWIENSKEWAEDEDEKHYEKSFYYPYTGGAKTNREISCKISQVKAREQVASEISAFIKSSFAKSMEGDANDTKEPITEYVSDEVTQLVQNEVVGSKILRTYWEKRKFMKEMGSKTDWTGYTCSVLLRIPKTQLDKAFARANKKIASKTKSNQSKEKVKKAIESARKEFTEQASKKI